MDSYERLFNRMEGKPVDRLPNLCIVMAFAAEQIHIPYGKYVTDYRFLAEGVIDCYEKFSLDAFNVISDPMREAEGFGASVIIPDDGVPYSHDKLIKDMRDVSKLKVIDPSLSRRMNDRLEAVRYLSERSQKDVPVIGWVEGAIAESCDLMDMSEFMCTMMDEPELISQLLEICLKQSTLFALEQIKAGADIIGIGDAASSLIGPSLYEEFALPYQQQLIAQIHKAGAKTKLHICGNLNPVLELVAQTGADIVDLDHMVDIQKASQLFPSNMCICGNFDPVSILLQGSEADVRTAVATCREIEYANQSIIAAGCEVPRFTPVQNMYAVADALK